MGKFLRFEWEWQLRSAPEQVWSFVADTHRINQMLGLPAIEYEAQPLEVGGSQLMAKGMAVGVWPLAYEDQPFNWIYLQWFTNKRIFTKGPFSLLLTDTRLKAHEGGTLITYIIEAEPAHFFGKLAILFQIGWKMQIDLAKGMAQIDAFIQKEVDQPFKLRQTPLKIAGKARLEIAKKQLIGTGYDEQLVDRFLSLIATGADSDVIRLQPFVIAVQWNTPRIQLLELFLSAAKVGILNLRWDLMCTLCRGAKFTADSLDEIRNGVHCPSCNIDFDINLSENVELTFTPSTQIRSLYDSSYCVGGPMITPHILVHYTIEGNETVILSGQFKHNYYQIRTQKAGVATQLEWSGQGQLSVAVSANEIVGEIIDGDDGTIQIQNNSSMTQRFYLEQIAWREDVVTAALVTTLQHFRDLFGDEVLRADEEIGVQNLTILFTDLVGSTGMYNRQGDARSYGIVREQFAFLQRIVREEMGTIVKTIGDAIMAAFYDPEDGVRAALRIQKEMHLFNETHNSEPLSLKIGVNMGPCIAVNLSGRLDYFGRTVNLAARLEGLCRGGEVVISESLSRDAGVAKLLEEEPVDLARFTTAIKGFDEQYGLYRLILTAVDKGERSQDQ